MTEDLLICDEGGPRGLVLPFNDYNWPGWIRGVLYAIGLVYCFLGVAIVSDLFMNSIETITSWRRKVTFKSGQVVHAFLWNDTVANLSLMALGSSAPEIFLSVIDLFRKKMHASDLGSATIAGSAAFNLLVIVAVCIMVIPDGELRVVEQYSVFVVTAAVSLGAYLWVAFILTVWTPNIVDLWEAIVTLLFLPPLIYVSFLADQGRFGSCTFLYERKKKKHPEPGLKDEEEPQKKNKLDHNGSKDEKAIKVGKSGEVTSPMSSEDGAIQASMSEGPTDVAVRSIPVTQRSNLSQIESSSAACSTPSRKGMAPNSSASGMISERLSMSSDPHTSKGQHLLRAGFSRGFSHNSLNDVVDVETATRMGNRRKSIAAHHNLSINRLRRQDTKLSIHSQGSISLEGSTSLHSGEKQSNQAIVQMLIDRQFFSSSLAKKTVKVVRSGCMDGELSVHYAVSLCRKQSDHITRMRAVTAKQESLGHDLQETDCWFAGLETMQGIEGQLSLPSGMPECFLELEKPDFPRDFCQDFVIGLSDAQVVQAGVATPDLSVSLGQIASSYVMMDNRPTNSGMLSFSHEIAEVDGSTEDRVLEVVVVRQTGCVGTMTCNVVTESLNAVQGKDYVEIDDQITFEEGVTEMGFRIELHGKRPGSVGRDFLVVLRPSEEEGCNVRFNPLTDGGENSEIMLVKVGGVGLDQARSRAPTGSGRKALPKVSQCLDRILNLHMVSKGMEDWRGQLMCALLCNGSWEAQKDASIADWVWHLMSMPWMLLFAFIPPTIFAGGWVCFFFCLAFIAGVTAIIADLAALFGCVLGVPDIVTAITFVALGTSMPDLFASKVAAQEDPTADASIVNVTGSNSVNVFLGLGLPWTMAAFYWMAQPRDREWLELYGDQVTLEPGTKAVFAVPAANLGFGIVAFCCACCAALCLLVFRRRVVGGELGGPARLKVATASTLVLYWVGYVFIVSWRALVYEKAKQETSLVDQAVPILGVLLVESAISIWPITELFLEAKRQAVAEAEAVESSPAEAEGVAAAAAGAKSPEGTGPSLADIADMPSIPVEPPVEQPWESSFRKTSFTRL